MLEENVAEIRTPSKSFRRDAHPIEMHDHVHFSKDSEVLTKH